MNLRNSVIRHLMAERLDFAAALGQAAGGGEVAALLDPLGPWEVKAYPAVGKSRPWARKNQHSHKTLVLFDKTISFPPSGSKAQYPLNLVRCPAV